MATGKRAARNAGSEPPMNAMSSAQMMLTATRCGVTASLNVMPCVLTDIPVEQQPRDRGADERGREREHEGFDQHRQDDRAAAEADGAQASRSRGAGIPPKRTGC